ncbi:hypothetical protein B566_EDAN004779 [Ephemera danica]|nr:hypothetical protein B566_EDAN004779 [Ephemera danica]
MDFLCKICNRRRNVEKVNNTIGLETPFERKIRWRSIRIMYLSIFINNISFGIVQTGFWPYLNMLDPSATKETLGFVIAAFPTGQLIFSPLFGYWGNHSSTIRIPLMFSLVLFLIGNAGYALLQLFSSESVRYWMIGSRFLVGLSTANNVVCRSYVADATTLNERTGAVSILTLMQVLGFIAGQVLQGVVTTLGDVGLPLFDGALSLNMYTVTGWIPMVLGLVNMVFILPSVLTEQRIAAREAMRDQNAASEKETWSGTKLDYVACWTLIFALFVTTFDFLIFDSLQTSILMDQFGWSKEDTLKFMSVVTSFGGIFAILTFIAIKPLSRRFNERSLMLYGDESTNTSQVLGCPVDVQPWCATTPAITVVQVLIGFVFTALGFAVSMALTQTIFSKVLGPRPQVSEKNKEK